MTEGKNKVNEGMLKALLDRDITQLRDLLRCPMSRAEALVEAFDYLLLNDSSIRVRTVRDDAGYRKGVYKPKWKNTPTKSVRVPLIYARDIIAFAHKVDKGRIDPSTILDEADYALASPTRPRT